MLCCHREASGLDGVAWRRLPSRVEKCRPFSFSQVPLGDLDLPFRPQVPDQRLEARPGPLARSVRRSATTQSAAGRRGRRRSKVRRTRPSRLLNAPGQSVVSAAPRDRDVTCADPRNARTGPAAAPHALYSFVRERVHGQDRPAAEHLRRADRSPTLRSSAGTGTAGSPQLARVAAITRPRGGRQCLRRSLSSGPALPFPRVQHGIVVGDDPRSGCVSLFGDPARD